MFLNYFILFNSEFVGDDLTRIVHNNDITKGIIDILKGQLSDRPLLMLSIWIDVKLWGINPIALRIMNILYLALNGLLLCKFFLFLNNFNNKAAKKNHLPFIIAVLFVLHPLHNQVINIIIQRGVLLSSIFGLLSILSFLYYLNNKKGYLYYFSLAAFGLGLLSKGIIITLPLFFLIWIIFVKRKPKLSYLLLPYIFLILIPANYYLSLDVDNQNTKYNSLQYFGVQLEIIFMYFKKMIFPYPLQYFYDFTIPKTLFNLKQITLLFGHILLIYSSFLFRKITPVAPVLFMGGYIALLPESSFFPIRHLAFEHRTFWPMIFFTAFIFTITNSIKLSKYLKTLLVFFSILFITLNQVRTHEIKGKCNWVHNLLSRSDGHHIANFFGIWELSFELKSCSNRELMINKFMKKYQQKYPTMVLYKILNMTLTIDKNHHLPSKTKMAIQYVNELKASISKIQLFEARIVFLLYAIEVSNNLDLKIPILQIIEEIIEQQFSVINKKSNLQSRTIKLLIDYKKLLLKLSNSNLKNKHIYKDKLLKYFNN